MTLQKNLVVSLLIAGGMLASTTAFAQNANTNSQRGHSAYNYASLGIADHDGGDSIIAEGSYTFNSPYFVGGYYRNFDTNSSSSADALAVRLGRYFWLNNGLTADFSGRVGHIDIGPFDSNFYGIEGNLRQRVDQFEFYGGLGWVNYTSGGSDNQYQIGVNYFIDSNLSVGVGYQDSEFGDGIRLRASYHF